MKVKSFVNNRVIILVYDIMNIKDGIYLLWFNFIYKFFSNDYIDFYKVNYS